jgi:hypothetical protein
MTSSIPESFGAEPVFIKWKIVRGDTARLRVQFLENDEVTAYDTDGWTYASTAYDFKGDALDELEVTASDGYVDIVATPEITSQWGVGYNSISAELAFDLEVTIDAETVWTPIIGTIIVLSDVSPVGGP